MQRAQSPSRLAQPNLRAMSAKQVLEYVKAQQIKFERESIERARNQEELKAALERVTRRIEARDVMFL